MNSRNPDPRRVWDEAPRSGRWRRFRGSVGSMGSMGSIGCVPFCALLVKKRSRNRFRPLQDEPKHQFAKYRLQIDSQSLTGDPGQVLARL